MPQPSRKSLASTTNRLVLAWKLDPSERNFRRVERHYRPFFKNLVKRIHSEEVREDLLQELRVALLVHMRNFDPNRSLSFHTYFHLGTKGAIGHYLRSLKRLDLRSELDFYGNMEIIEPACDGGIPDETRMEIEILLSRLNVRDATLLRDFYLEGLTAKQICEYRHITVSEIFYRLHSIRKKLRAHYAHLFFHPSVPTDQ